MKDMTVYIHTISFEDLNISSKEMVWRYTVMSFIGEEDNTYQQSHNHHDGFHLTWQKLYTFVLTMSYKDRMQELKS